VLKYRSRSLSGCGKSGSSTTVRGTLDLYLRGDRAVLYQDERSETRSHVRDYRGVRRSSRGHRTRQRWNGRARRAQGRLQLHLVPARCVKDRRPGCGKATLILSCGQDVVQAAAVGAPRHARATTAVRVLRCRFLSPRKLPPFLMTRGDLVLAPKPGVLRWRFVRRGRSPARSGFRLLPQKVR
jgi:hypothetical protein